MRTYQLNSPQAAGRLIALAMLADGTLCKSEMDVLDRLSAHWRLDLSPDQLKGVVHEVCEDLLSAHQLTWGGTCVVDPETLATLFAEVNDHHLCAEILRAAVAIIEADGHVADSELKIVVAAAEHWDMTPWLQIYDWKGSSVGAYAEPSAKNEAHFLDAVSAIRSRQTRVRMGF